jgi:hypothetical protein
MATRSVPVIDATEVLTGGVIERAYVDNGYRGHDAQNPRRVFISGQKRGYSASIKREFKHRSAIEPVTRNNVRRKSRLLTDDALRGLGAHSRFNDLKQSGNSPRRGTGRPLCPGESQIRGRNNVSSVDSGEIAELEHRFGSESPQGGGGHTIGD